MPGFGALLRRRHALGFLVWGKWLYTCPRYTCRVAVPAERLTGPACPRGRICGPRRATRVSVSVQMVEHGKEQAGSIASKVTTGTENDYHGGDAGPSSNLRRAPLAPAAKYPGDENELTGLPRRPGSQGVRVAREFQTFEKGDRHPPSPPLHRKSTALCVPPTSW
ncbi:uncharacterized protein LY79DRAFT_199623 [Colletotrichum navitas]|uniref:Uncharacterized protein n=1 Tax=Colletotrichum navitas TaxID=681940 RepID=A0AAD8V3F3_9PEZI|nr:uncharacterized protein LY79DRAFT_199623 [Colletotrichum navitas]KAK1590760.1 hypothetical protein LY79DRAFT_199623 [Colletotrichum navitas]